jgi:methanogenic corrinoid protein MtbC1
MAILYRIGAVSKLTGLSVDTLRAWERRYGAVVPMRGDQQRGYGEADIERLILLRSAVERGHAISSVAKLSDAELRQFLAEKKPNQGAVTNLIEPLLAALDDFNYEALNEQLGRMASFLAPADLVHQVVLPLMREIGERWHRGEISIAQEHMMSAQMHHVLGSLMRLYRPAAGAVKVLFTSPEGELHAIGILAAAMLAAAAGLSPIYLGPNLPVKDIIHATRRSGAKAVVLQLISPGASGQKQVRQLLDGLPAGVELWVGGTVEIKDKRVHHLPNFSMLDEHYKRLAAVA